MLLSGSILNNCVYFPSRGICATNKHVACRIEALVKPIAKAYLELYNSALEIREFFGLRDFYRLILNKLNFLD